MPNRSSRIICVWASAAGGWTWSTSTTAHFWSPSSGAVRAYDPQAPVVGEVWEDASSKIAYGERKNYFCGGRLDGVTNYPLRESLIAFLTGRDTRALAETLHAQYLRYPAANRRCLMNLLGSHDTVRIVNALAGADGEGLTEPERAALRLTDAQRQSAVRVLKAAYLFLCTQTGYPCLYYGDETALEGCADPFCRRPYPWAGADGELIAYFCRCAALRRQYEWGNYTDETGARRARRGVRRRICAGDGRVSRRTQRSGRKFFFSSKRALQRPP